MKLRVLKKNILLNGNIMMVNTKQYKDIMQNLVKNIQDKFFEILTFISKLVVKVDSSLF